MRRKILLLKRVENEVKHEMAIMIKEAESQAKEEAERRARKIVSLAIQRCAADHVAESTVSVVSLPSDEMKGRIIGTRRSQHQDPRDIDRHRPHH